METTRERTCEERIDERRDSRLGSIAILVCVAQQAPGADELSIDELSEITGELKPDPADYSDDYLQEQAQDRMWELPLAVTVRRVIEVLLSTGGPEDALRAELDADGDIVRIEYIFKDWFDGARRTLHGSDFDTAEAFIRSVWVGGA